jgi:hypothetical protein
MCIDVIARHLGTCVSGGPNPWIDQLSTLLEEFVTISVSIHKRILDMTQTKNQTYLEDYLKLLGSLYLCCGTMCGVIKVRALGQLQVTNAVLCIHVMLKIIPYLLYPLLFC